MKIRLGYLECILIVLMILIVALVLVGFITAVIELEKAKVENHMLKTARENSKAQIEELSTTVDTLNGEAGKASEWNEKMGSLKDEY